MSTMTVPAGDVTFDSAEMARESVLDLLASATGPHLLDRILDVPVTAYGGRTTREMLTVDPEYAYESLLKVMRNA